MSADVGDPDPALQTIERKCDDLWLDGHDIVIYTTQQTTEGVIYTMYGIHKSTLGISSEAFQAIFGGPQQALVDGSPTYEEEKLPVMGLPDDPKAVDAYIHAMCLPWYLQKLVNDQKDPRYGLLDVPEAYPAIFELAQKYIAPGDLLEALGNVYCEPWPQFLQAFEEKDSARMERASQGIHDPEEYGEPWDQSDRFPDSMATYAQVRKHSRLLPPGKHSTICNILPTVAYDIMHAHTVPDPSRGYAFRRLNWSLLEEEDVLDIRRGMEALRYDCTRKLSFDCFTELSLRIAHCRRTRNAFCATELECYKGLRKFWCNRIAPLLSLARPIDLTNFSISCDARGVCASCAGAVERHLENVQHVVWVKLPVYFRLTKCVSPGWGFGPDLEGGFWQHDLPHLWLIEITKIWSPDEGRRMLEDWENEELV